MSIQSHINKLAKLITYRRQHLSLYTDTVFLDGEIFDGGKPITKELPSDGFYDLCDVLYTFDLQGQSTTHFNDLLLLCKEHPITRPLQIIDRTV